MAVPTQDPLKQGGTSALGFQQLSAAGAPGVSAQDFETYKNCYIASTASMTLVATPADIMQIGSAAGIVTRVKRVRIAVTSTVTGVLSMQFIRRSTGSTGGTSASFTLNKEDVNDATASSVATLWTANPTATGTTVASLMSFQMPVSATTSITERTFTFSDINLKSLVLRGATDFLVINGSLSTLTNADNKITLTVEATEENG